MTQHISTSSNQSPAPNSEPTWHEVYTYWQSLAVPQIEVVEYDPEVHDEQVLWFEMNRTYNERRGFFYHLQQSPRADTARALASTVAKGGPGMYAAFALMCAIRQLGEWNPIKGIASEHISLIAPHLRHAWNANAREVLPVIVEAPRSFEQNPDWHLRVDLAAGVWKGLAAQYQIVRQPLWK